MTTFNIVRFKVKPDQDAAFLHAHSDGRAAWPGLAHGTMIKTGDRTYCLIGEWTSRDAMIAARPAMIATLNTFRDVLEDQGDGRGITDAVSGDTILRLV
jgi:hypothetical protein